MDRSPKSRTTIIALYWKPSKKIGIVKAGFRVDNGLDQLEQCPAFTYANNLSQQYTWFTESNKVSNNKSGLVDGVIRRNSASHK
jgi:hypothetical protein